MDFHSRVTLKRVGSQVERHGAEATIEVVVANRESLSASIQRTKQ